MEQELATGTPAWERWHKGFKGKRWFALQLIEYSTSKTPADLDAALHELRDEPSDTVEMTCFGESFQWPKAFVTKAMKILAMVVAY